VNHERKDIVELLLITRVKRFAQDFDDMNGRLANVQFLRGRLYIFIAPVFFNGYAQIDQ
jgi:hypothetical protein